MCDKFLKIFSAAIVGILFFALGTFEKTFAAPNSEVQWYWLKSDDKYSKFFDPDSVRVIKQARIVKKIKNRDGEIEEVEKVVPTEIEAWTKTAYTYEGATETISNYGIAKTLPDAKVLSYSLALFRINPQTRTIQYAREDFYNAKNQVIWSKADQRVKEINSQSFDEDFYCAIVDEVFRQGEVDRKNAKDRWIDLWSYTNSEGYTTTVTGDTTTMQMKGTNLILWMWQETKNPEGKTVEIRFMKKAINLPQGTEKMTAGEIWTPNSKTFRDFTDDSTDSYKMIKSTDPEYKGLVRLRAYAKGYSTWVTRYSIS